MAHRPGRAAVFVPLLCSLILAPLATVRAETLGVFAIRNVAVDTTAETAAAARGEALAAGQRQALVRLFKRLALRSAMERLPMLDDAEVTELVQDFEVQEEKTSPVRYLATLTIRFKPDDVRALLRDAGVPFAETLSKPVLVLPVYRAAGTYILWDDPNPWREAWANLPPRDALVPLVVPLGDLADIADISAEQAVKGGNARLQAIAVRYGAADTLVAVASLGLDPVNQRPTLHVAVTRFGTNAGERTTVESYIGDSMETLGQLMASVAEAVATGVEELWKRDNLLRFDREDRLAVVVPLTGLSDWLEVRRRLAGVAFVQRSELVYLSRREARVVLRYIGDEPQLRLALTQSDLTLIRDPTSWFLRLGDRGGEEAAQTPPVNE